MKKIFLLAITAILTISIQAQKKPVGLNVGDAAPDFSLKDQNGTAFTLEDHVKKGTVVVFFYRGQWCPYCNKQIKGLQDSLMAIQTKGATVVAITPETTENVQKTVSKTGATFPILFDNGLKVMKLYDVNFAVDAGTVEKYKKYGIDFEKANGANGANLPVPAMYIIKNGKIAWKYFDENYSKRPSVTEVLQQL
jgi:peroxiredoxin